MRSRGETPETRAKEARLLKAVAARFEASYHQLPSNSAKWRIDGCLIKNGAVAAWVECKWYGDGKKAMCWMNVAKYMEMRTLKATFGVPCLFVFREDGRWGFIDMGFDDRPPKILGGTPSHREANDDDYEPLIALDKSKVIYS
jgi:hypothetical protein